MWPYGAVYSPWISRFKKNSLSWCLHFAYCRSNLVIKSNYYHIYAIITFRQNKPLPRDSTPSLYDLSWPYRSPHSLLMYAIPVRTCKHNATCIRSTKFPLVGYNMTSYGRRAFSYAGHHAWNWLPEHLRQTTLIELLKHSLKTFLFGQISRSAH